MSPPHNSNSTIIDTQFDDQPLFTDASDSFHSHQSTPISQPPSISHKHSTKKSKKFDQFKSSPTVSNSAITTVGENDHPINATETVSSVSISGSNILFLLAGLVIKTTWFQLHLLFTSVTLPMWLFYYSCIFMIDPFTNINLAKYYIMSKSSRFFSFCFDYVKWVMHFWIRKHKCILKFCVRIGWRLLWLFYVGFVFSSLLVFALVVSGVILKSVIEEPVQISRQLSFDYTKDSPTAFVQLMSCTESSGLESGERVWFGCDGGSRVVPLDHKVRGTVSLMLPESDYNRNLGVFQVRVDFFSGDGKCLFSTSQPSMLRYKSQPIRLLLTFLKLAPLITGYSSESQMVNIKLREYTEGTIPTSSLRVILEQRAEFRHGAGVPVIYEASLKLESEPPFLKRILWSWKWTIYIWATVMIFVVELLFMVICCTPLIVPRLQPRRV